MRKLIVLILVLLPATLAAQENGWDLFRAGRYDKARAALEKDLKLYPKSAILIDGIAWCDYYLGDYDKAETGFRKALDVDPKYGYSLQGLEAVESIRRAPLEEARGLLTAGKYEEARIAFQHIIEGATPTRVDQLHDAIAGEGWCIYYLRDYPEAMKIFRSALKKKRGYADAYRGIAYCDYMRGNYAEALVSLQLSFQEEPNDYTARLTAAGCHFAREDYPNALREYEAAAKVVDGAWGAHVGRGWCRERLGNKTAALAAFGEAIDISPYALDTDLRHLAETRKDWWPLLTRTGWSALRQYLYSWAKQEFDAALLRDTDDHEARRGLAFVSFRLGDYAGALDAADAVPSGGPKLEAVTFPVMIDAGATVEIPTDLLALKGWAQLRLGRFEEALKTFDAVLAQHPTWVDAVCGRGWTLYSQGNYLDAEKAFASAENMLVGYPDATSGISAVQTWRYADYDAAWANIYAGRCQEAIRALQRILRASDRQFPSSRYDIVEASIGWAFYYAGNYDEAIQSFDRALQRNAEQGLAHKGKGFTQAARRQWGAAAEGLRKAREDGAFAEDVETICALGQALRKTDEEEDAENAYREALRIQPRCAPALAGLGWIALDAKRMNDARDLFSQAVQLDVASIDTAEFRKAISKSRDLSSIYATLGWAYYTLGSYAQAEKDFRTATEEDPKETEPLRGLGLALLGQEKIPEASRMLNRYFRAAPSSENPWGVLSSTLSTWGWALYGEKDYTEAIRVFERLAGMHKRGKIRYADPHDGLGWCYLRKDLTDKAQSAFLQAIRIAPRYESSLQGLEILKAMEP